MSRVDVSGGVDACWPWTGARSSNGYGAVFIGDRQESAHRAAWALFRWPIAPGRSKCVLHRCDNRPCVNPGHLFLGSPLDNMLDRSAKGRAPVGEESSSAKLSSADVQEVWRLRSDGWTQQSIADLFGCTQANISYILLGKGRTKG